MINLNEIANKISEVLNSIDNPLRIDNQRVLFEVATEGYRVDTIANKQEGKNMIPVYLQLAGGENQPIPNLNQQSKTINIGVYYPIKYKEIFFHLEDYLGSVFVGKKLNFGELTGVCLCNLGVAQYGNIEGMDLQQYKKFIADTKYEKTIESSGNWHSLVIQLFLTKTASGYIFGNDITYALKMTYNKPNITGVVLGASDSYSRYSNDDETISGVAYYCWRKQILGGYEKIYTKLNPTTQGNIADYISKKNAIEYYKKVSSEMVLQEDKISHSVFAISSNAGTLEAEVVRSECGTGASISPIAEQRIGLDDSAKNVANITNYNKSFVVFPNLSQDFWKMFLTLYNTQKLNAITEMNLTKNYSNGYSYDTKQIVLTYNENSDLGSPLSFTLTLGDSI